MILANCFTSCIHVNFYQHKCLCQHWTSKVILKNLCQINREKWHRIIGLICICLVTSEVEYLLYIHWPLEFLILWLVFPDPMLDIFWRCLLLICKTSLYIRDIDHMCFKYFSYSTTVLSYSCYLHLYLVRLKMMT